jgi:hypothetical protein
MHIVNTLGLNDKEAYTKVLMQYEKGLIATLSMVGEYVRLIEIYNQMLDKTNTLKECE